MIYAIDDLPYGAEVCRLLGDHMTGEAVDNHQRSRVLECVLLAGVYYPVEHPGWIDTDAAMTPDCGVLRFGGSDTGFRPDRAGPREVKAGQIVTLKAEWLDPGEPNLPHVAVEDSWRGSVRVTVAADVPNMRFKPINDWRLEWIAEPVEG